MLTLTESAIAHVRELQKEPGQEGKPLRIYVEAGGCSGYSYGMAFDDKQEDDHVLTFDGVEIVVDPKSATLLAGLEVDYANSWQQTGFTIKNPNAKSTCGCGHSFSA